MAKLADIAVYLERDDNTNEPLDRQRLEENKDVFNPSDLREFYPVGP